MAALSFGLLEIIMMMLLSGGTPGDVASMLPAEAYLRHRQIGGDVDSLMSWATKEPNDPKTQLAQLVAMRRIGEQREAFATSPKVAEYRQTLARIAEGKLAADTTGFAAEYATKTLAALDGKKLAEPKSPANAAEMAWAYFPKNALLAGYVEAAGQESSDATGKIIDAINKAMTDRERAEMFNAIDKVGNVRITSVAFATTEEGGTITYTRIRGKANPEWLMKAGLETKAKGSSKTKDGAEIRFVAIDNVGTLMAMIGDSDLLVVTDPDRKANRPVSLRELLEKRIAEKGKDSLAITLQEDLKKIPKNAVAAVVGAFPADIKKEMGDKAPEQVSAYAMRSPQGVEIHVDALMGNTDAVRASVDMILMTRKQALDGVAQLQNFQMPGLNVPALAATLNSVQVQGKDRQITGQVLIHPDVFSSAPLMMFGRQKALAPPVDPNQK